MRLGVKSYLLVITIVECSCNSTYAEEMKPTIALIDSPSELYFDEMGQVFFYPTQWKVISYVNIEPTQMLWKQVKSHQLQIVNYCMKIHNAT